VTEIFTFIKFDWFQGQIWSLLLVLTALNVFETSSAFKKTVLSWDMSEKCQVQQILNLSDMGHIIYHFNRNFMLSSMQSTIFKLDQNGSRYNCFIVTRSEKWRILNMSDMGHIIHHFDRNLTLNSTLLTVFKSDQN
jgi:hypothetical protein